MRRLFVVLLLLAFVAAFATSSRGEAKAKASAAYEPTMVLVGFSDATSASARAAVHERFGGVVVNRFDWINVDVVRIPTGASPPEVAASYAKADGVAYADPNWTYHVDRLDGAQSIPNDTRFGEMWGMHNTGQVGGKVDADIDAPEGWDLAFGPGNFPNSGGIRVGVLDTGILQTHEDLLGKTKACARATTGTGAITPGQCPDDFNHGTHVAGTIAANTNNALGVVGVAPNAEIAMFKAFNSGGSGQLADLVAGWHWLHTTGQAIVINHSWGGAPPGGALQAEATEAHNAGALSIASAGNCGCGSISYPAGFAEVVSVPATTRFDTRASFSAFNADTEVSGPGQTVLSTSNSGGYVNFDGTSMAAPHVTGTAALIRWKFGTDANGTRAILDAAVDDLGTPGRDTQFGFGRVNLAKALAGGGGTGSIAGTVKKKGGGGGPIAGANVNCPGGGSATTAADGSYQITNVTPGNYSCTASKAGFKSKTKPVTVNAGQTSTLNFKLKVA